MLKDALRERRKKAGMTQRDLAKELGCGIVTVQNWESGKNLPEPVAGMKLCKMFGLSMDELYFGRSRVTLPQIYENLEESEIELVLDVLNKIKYGRESEFKDFMRMIFIADGEHRLQSKEGASNGNVRNVDFTKPGGKEKD